MHKRLKPVLAFVLSLFMSVSTLSNTYTVFAEDEITQEETNTVDETTTDDTETDDTETDDTETEETNRVDETVEDNTNVEEQMGDSSMMEYFLVDSPVVSSQETENFVLSLNNTEGYSNFKITIQKEDGTTLDLESSEQIGNLVKFSNVFSNKGDYQVTSLHYVYNGQSYYLNFSDLEMDVKFGVDQEYVGYDETLPDLTQDSQNQEGVIQVTDVNKAEEEIANGMASEASIMSMDEFSRAATGGMTICLDPGHGGSDSGANAFGQKESALTLKIANYCKEELAKYDVNVVMTRTTDTRPSENTAQDLIDRVMMAKKAGASYIISIHLNSAASTSAHGAEVYFPNTSGNASLSSNGQAMAKAIQSQLVALGLYDRGIKIRNYMDGSTSSNPNSSDRDYYGIIRYAKEQNISGLIIEHCFLNNPDEYNKYLSSDAKLQQLGVADAKGIVNALGLQQKYSELDTLASQNKNLIADGTYLIQSSINTKYVFDIYGGYTTNGANVQLYKGNDTVAQLFKVTHDDKGYVTITNAKSGRVLDVYGGTAQNEQNIWQYTSNGTRAQKWVIKKDGNSYVFVSALNPNYVLDLSGGQAISGRNIQLYSYTGSSSQKWNLTKYVTKEERLDTLATQNKNTIADGEYDICSAKNNSYGFDVYGGSTSSGANIQLYTSNNSAAQKWVFEYISKDVQVSLTKIMGTSQTSVAQMVRYYKANASGYDTFKAKYEGKYDGSLAKGGASTIEQFAQIFYEEANAEGVKAEVAFTQCMKETGFLKYGGDVLPNQYNFAGIGATGAVHGASFKDVRTGIRAQIQHLKAYASTSPLNNACVDPRFNLVTRNTAPYVEWLGIQENPNGYGWATGKNYGYDIVGMVKVLLSK